jgi:hypothetical protein
MGNSRVGNNALGRQAEAEFRRQAKAAGYLVNRSGWPDYLIWRNGYPIAVEVKTGRGRLSEAQRVILGALAAGGIPCYIWRPESGFERIPACPLEGA